MEAAKARDRKAYELFGTFAFLNFPEEMRGRPSTGAGGPGPRVVELSGAAQAHCHARATLTILPIGQVA